MTLVSSQLGVASGLRVEMGSGWLTRSIQGLGHQKHLGISNVTLDNRSSSCFRLVGLMTSALAVFIQSHEVPLQVKTLLFFTFTLAVVSQRCQLSDRNDAIFANPKFKSYLYNDSDTY